MYLGEQQGAGGLKFMNGHSQSGHVPLLPTVDELRVDRPNPEI